MRSALSPLLVALALASSLAVAAEPTPPPAPGATSGGRGESVLSGRPVHANATVLHGQIGWPGFSATLLHGASPKLSVGGRASLLYGYEGISGLPTIPGLKLQGAVRLGVFEKNKINVGVNVEPGLAFYFFPGYSETALVMPVGLTVGMAPTDSLMLSLGIDLQTYMVFGPYARLVVPVRMGGALEYFLDKNVGVTFSVRLGPSAVAANYWYAYSYCYDRFGRAYYCGGGPAYVTAEMLVGLSYRL